MDDRAAAHRRVPRRRLLGGARAVLVGTQQRRAFARTVLPAVVTIAALLLPTTLIHLDKFDLDSLFGWFWLVVTSW